MASLRPIFVSLGGFQTPPTKMSCTTPHHIPKYEILQNNYFCELSLSLSVNHHILHNLLTWSVTAFLAHATSDVMTTYKISANSSGRYLYKYLLRRWTFLWNDGFVLGLVTSLCRHVLCRTLSDHWQRAMNDLEVKTPARRMQGMEKESNDSDKQTRFAAALGFVCLSFDNNWYRSVSEYLF